MIKTITIAHRKQGMTHEEYNKYWLETHGPLAARLIPGIKRYVQNHYVPVPGVEYEGDGIVEMWYDDVETWQKSMKAIRASKELMADGANFIGPGKNYLWVVEEHVILDKMNKK
jgi:uncharacterized protein (TIGR02118 family)